MRLLASMLVVLGLSLGCGFTNPVIWNLLTSNKGPAFDQVFLSMMIAHYEGLLQIQTSFLPQVRDKQLQSLIQQSMASDKARISTFQGQLRIRHNEATNIMRGEMSKDIGVLKADLEVGKEPFSVFSSLIMANSASATGMANLAKDRSLNTQILRMARELVQTEQTRTEQIQVWLLEHAQ